MHTRSPSTPSTPSTPVEYVEYLEYWGKGGQWPQKGTRVKAEGCGWGGERKRVLTNRVKVGEGEGTL